MKGISPVISTLILITVAVVAGIAVYSFTVGWIGPATPQSPTPILIDAAVLYDDRTVDIYVRNISSRPVNVTALLLMKGGDIIELQTDPSTFPVVIPPGGMAYISPASAPGPGITPGEMYTVKVLTADGSSATVNLICRS